MIVDLSSAETSTQIVATALVNNSIDHHNPNPLNSEDSKEVSICSEKTLLDELSLCTSDDRKSNKNKDNDMRKSFFKIRERLESLASSQNSMSNFEIFKNVSHSLGSLRNIKEKSRMKLRVIVREKIRYRQLLKV
ncbi:uncharacterized protein CEXT_319411 [Caerostris extrusa]|uniref:Uncharacterized protein n=1 Tax=Caerostris extrusa TaxID=172846 RepID=A0AAV4UVV1_CAEEX|nr:uncharacterized protein CEXT_319411 [Caerostris extrusa]